MIDQTATPEADSKDAHGQVSAIVAQVDAPQHPQQDWSSVIWPWHMGPWAGGAHHVVHRLAVGCRGVSPATRHRWSQSVRSWREPWLQILWVYDPEDASLLGAQPHSHLLVRNASLVMPSAEWSEWQARAFPIPLIKDLFQLQCLHMFGGWWADMDYFMLQQQPPPTPPPEETTWLLGTEYERRTSAYMKSESGVMMVEGELAAVNLGLMWARAGSDLLKEAEAKARAWWAGVQKMEWIPHAKGVSGTPALYPGGFCTNRESSGHETHRLVAISQMDHELGDTARRENALWRCVA